MKTFTLIGLGSLVIFSLGNATVSAEEASSGLSAVITPATNHVSTLSHLEFSVVVTNGSSTNAMIHPWILKNGLGTVKIYDARGLVRPYYPDRIKAPTPAEIASELLAVYPADRREQAPLF